MKKWNGIYDIAIIEGSITTKEAEERAIDIRKRSKAVIAYGACAVIGGINGMKKPQTSAGLHERGLRRQGR